MLPVWTMTEYRSSEIPDGASAVEFRQASLHALSMTKLSSTCSSSININPSTHKVTPRHLDLSNEFFMGFWSVVEGEDAPAQLEQQVGARGYNRPEWELRGSVFAEFNVSNMNGPDVRPGLSCPELSL